MPKPLRSEVGQPRDMQFTHFGVLDAGAQSKSSLFTSITVNVLLALIIVIIGAAARKTIENRKSEVTLIVPLKEKPPAPIKPKIIPPKIVPPKPIIKPPVEAKIKLPDIKVEPPKVLPVMVPKPLPAVMPAPPKVVVAAAAPKPVAINLGQSASVVNHDTHPSAVALGHPDNPIAPSNRAATASVNLGQRGLPGMPASNMGGGPPSAKVNLGSGQPNGSMGGTGARAVQGVKLGVTGGTPGGTGNGVGIRPAQVQLGQATPPPIQSAQIARAPVSRAPQLLYKPKPVYTADATAMHLEGTVSVRIRVSASGAVSVVGVTNGLGHGLDESAVRAVEGTRFKPALDATGSPVDWEGVVNISFQMAS